MTCESLWHASAINFDTVQKEYFSRTLLITRFNTFKDHATTIYYINRFRNTQTSNTDRATRVSMLSVKYAIPFPEKWQHGWCMPSRCVRLIYNMYEKSNKYNKSYGRENSWCRAKRLYNICTRIECVCVALAPIRNVAQDTYQWLFRCCCECECARSICLLCSSTHSGTQALTQTHTHARTSIEIVVMLSIFS